jgi:hypothetical protein
VRARSGLRRAPIFAALLLALAAGSVERSAKDPSPSADTTLGVGVTTSPPPTLTPCDPGLGFPKPRAGCPDSEPETGWLWVDRDSRVLIEPFRTLGNDAEGEAYAQRRGLEFSFSNDYHDAAAGPRHELELLPATICTGTADSPGSGS